MTYGVKVNKLLFYLYVCLLPGDVVQHHGEFRASSAFKILDIFYSLSLLDCFFTIKSLDRTFSIV